MSVSITVLSCNFDSTEGPTSLNNVSFVACLCIYEHAYLRRCIEKMLEKYNV
jgi:hypothetical protein